MKVAREAESGADVLRGRRKEDGRVQLGLVERSSGEGDSTGRPGTSARPSCSLGGMVGMAGKTRRWCADGRNWATRLLGGAGELEGSV